MAPLLQELSTLEVEPLGIVENTPEQGQSLNTLVEDELAALLTRDGFYPTNKKKKNGGGVGCCCFPCTLCCTNCA
jgi:hypothetical protein